jgi:putative transcriptional regulator
MNFEKIFDTLKPREGRLLVSEPFMLDPNFKRTVILLVEHNDKGTVGFVINKELDVTPHEAIANFPVFNQKLMLGGPVQRDSLFFIHTLGDKLPGSMKVMDGIWWGGDYDKLKEMISDGELDETQVRFFIGYSGWEKDQLVKELGVNSWIVAPAEKEYLFETISEDLWKTVLKKLGKQHALVAEYPEDPSLN